MSGYRTLHRHTEHDDDAVSSDNESSITASTLIPVFAVTFSPCQQTHVNTRSAANPNAKPPTRLLTTSADGLIRSYKITDKSIKADVLDAAALSMELDQIMLTSSNALYPKSKEESILGLGCAALSVVRNYVGEDPSAGDEVAASMRLDGHVAIWKRGEQPSYPDSKAETKNEDGKLAVVKPDAELNIKGTTGTTMMLLSPKSTGFSRHGIVMMVGMLDGSVSFICIGIGIPDSRKCNDTSKYSEQGTVLDNIGSGNSIPLSLAVHPLHHLTFAVGRKDGTIDIYSAGNGNAGGSIGGSISGDDLYGHIRRCHHLIQHAGNPVRALSFTPDGSLLISGCDDGHIYIHDTSSFKQNDSIRMVAAIHNAHRGYILSVDVLPDSERFVTSSVDKTVKVWNVGTPNNGPVHSFDTGHENMIWDVSCSADGRRCVSCSDDGFVQVYSCEE
jgi:WD40 repeat protein